MRKFFREFKEFIAQGNVMQMAVAFVLGAAFKAVINSFVSDIIGPIISLIGGKDISTWKTLLKTGKEPLLAADGTTQVVIDGVPQFVDSVYLYWGKFIMAIIDFILIAFILFLLIKLSMHFGDRAKRRREIVKAKREAARREKAGLPPAEEPIPEPLPEAPSAEALLLEIRDLLAQQQEAGNKPKK